MRPHLVTASPCHLVCASFFCLRQNRAGDSPALQAFWFLLVPRKNQKAHEVSRELTAWACAGIGPILSASLLPAWARFGPLGMRAHLTAPSYGRLIATVPPRPLTQRGGSAVSRLDGRGISLAVQSTQSFD